MEQLPQSDPTMTDSERYRLLIDAITDYAVYMIDPAGIVASWNSGAKRLKGYEPEEIVGQHFSRFYTAEDREAGLPPEALEVALREGRFDARVWQLRKSGTRFWAHVVIDPIRSPSGELIGYAKITQDLTEREAAEEARKRSEEQFRLLVRGVTDYAIYMLDPQGHVVSWNAGAERIKGFTEAEIIGEHFSRFYPQADRERGVPQKGLAVAREKGRFEMEGWRLRKDGSRFWASVVIDAIRDDRGELAGFAKITRDITEKRKAEQELEEAREALFQAQKLEAVGQLTGGVAHDFNNLLMVVLSSLELLRKRLGDDEKLVSLVANAAEAAQRGASLTQRMLAFARRQELDRQVVDLPDLVRGMSDLMQRSIGPSIRIETRFPLSLPKILTDANQFEAALLNLVVNARDAMPAGGPLAISAREETIVAGHPTNLPEGEYVCLAVEDNGEGMDEESLSRATEPFFTTKGVGKGTGLGLSMVQGLVEQSGGRLLLTSRRGVGTKVEIWMPASEPEAQAAEPAPIASREARKSGHTRNLKVLAVDDDALVLMNTVAMLEDLGHSVVEARSGSKALEIMRQTDDLDVVVTDQAMPRMTGVELAAAIREEWPELPVILATGYAEIPDRKGLDLLRLSKPFAQEQLERALSDVFQRNVAENVGRSDRRPE